MKQLCTDQEALTNAVSDLAGHITTLQTQMATIQTTLSELTGNIKTILHRLNSQPIQPQDLPTQKQRIEQPSTETASTSDTPPSPSPSINTAATNSNIETPDHNTKKSSTSSSRPSPTNNDTTTQQLTLPTFFNTTETSKLRAQSARSPRSQGPPNHKKARTIQKRCISKDTTQKQ